MISSRSLRSLPRLTTGTIWCLARLIGSVFSFQTFASCINVEHDVFSAIIFMVIHNIRICISIDLLKLINFYTNFEIKSVVNLRWLMFMPTLFWLRIFINNCFKEKIQLAYIPADYRKLSSQEHCQRVASARHHLAIFPALTYINITRTLHKHTRQFTITTRCDYQFGSLVKWSRSHNYGCGRPRWLMIRFCKKLRYKWNNDGQRTLMF